MTSTFLSHSEQDTILFAKQLASFLEQGDIILLCGDLGSGKTKFTQGILSYFGLEEEISSPTFTIVNEHHKEDISIYHFDVYRLQDADEFYAIGAEEYLQKGICIIEWGEIIESALPPAYLTISFSKFDTDDTLRKLTLEAHGERFEHILQKIKGKEDFLQ